MSTRFGVDVGGTFTDCVFFDDETGDVLVGKGATVSAAPDEGVIDVVRQTINTTALRNSKFFLHGTTVGINALLERKGATLALLTTRGFRDVLETRRGERDSLYDVRWTAPMPLVPRRLRIPVTERITASGAVEVPLESRDIENAVEVLRREGVEAVAVVFINSYVNASHELEAERLLREFGFDGEISLSSLVSGEFHEYERTSTTVIDAYVRPRVSRYLSRLESELASIGFDGSSLVTSSGGGAMFFSEASTRPFKTIMSGPVAGAVGAAELCRDLGIGDAIAADVGGTSFDACLILEGRPQLKFEGSVDGMPLQMPWVDVKSIGAGGGSLAYLDEGGLLRVGPESAGAQPGPICYMRGGTAPTVTDAAAALGMLAHGDLAGGMSLALSQAADAIRDLGESLALSADDTARGIITIANAAMADAIRSVTVERGYDPRTATLVAFGGAGPLFGCLLAEELEIVRVVVPNYAGNFSAWGLLGQDLSTTAAQTHIADLDDDGLAGAQDVVSRLLETVRSDSVHSDSETTLGEDRQVSLALDLRYSGQENSLPIPTALVEGQIQTEPSSLEEEFGAQYEQTFQYRLDEPVEIVAVRLTARTPLPRSTGGRPVAPADWACRTDAVDAYSFKRKQRLEFAVIDRLALDVGERVLGPAIVLEPTTTTYVDEGFAGQVLANGVLDLRKE